MKKGNISIIFLITLFSINLVSAQFFSGYNRFSFRGFLDSIDPSTMILGTLFFIVLILLLLILRRLPLFRDAYGYPNRAMIGITAVIISLFTVWGVNRSGLGIEDFFYSIGLSSDLLYVILPIILIAMAIFIVWKWTFARLLLISGLLLMVLTVSTEIFFEKGLVLTIGIGMFLIGLWLWWRRRRRNRGQGEQEGPPRRRSWWRRRRPSQIRPPNTTTSSAPRTQQPQISQQNIRREYRALMQDNQRLFNINRRIPAGGTREGGRRHNNLQRMKQIENIFRQQGWRL